MLLLVMLLTTTTAWAEKTMYVLARPIDGTIDVPQYDENGNSMLNYLSIRKVRLTFYYGERPTGYPEGTEVWTNKVENVGTCIFDVPQSTSGYPAWCVNPLTPNAVRRSNAVTEVDFDASFWDARPTTTYRWFNHLGNLKQVNAINLNPSSLTNTSYMFYYCDKLTTIYSNISWKTENKVNSNGMFYNCTSLKGAISYNSNKIGISYANPTTGYFMAPDLTWNREGQYFEINDEQDLIDLGNYTNTDGNTEGLTFKLTADLDFSSHTADDCNPVWGHGNFIPIGHNNQDGLYFRGTFDGQGHTITGLRFISNSRCGLFYNVGSSVKIQNVILISPQLSGNNYTGGIIGAINGGTVDNCAVVNGMLGSSNVYSYCCGGIVGAIYVDYNDVIISNCTVVNTSVGGAYKGIIAGGHKSSSNDFKIQDCTYHNPNNLAVCGLNGYTDGGGNKQVYRVTTDEHITATGDVAVSLGGSDYYTASTNITLGHNRPGYACGYQSSDVTISNGAFTMPTNDVTVTATWYDLAPFGYNADPQVDGSAEHPYIISTAEGWGAFCDALQDNTTWNRFSGKTVKLGNNIGTAQAPITRMAGSDGHDFCGTFDGDGHTLYVNLNSDDITDGEPYVAPFRYVSNVNSVAATIRNLHVTGNIDTDMQFTAGLIGGCWGTVSIENCAVSTDINSTIDGDGSHGGIVGIHSNGTLTITGCVFDGRLLGTTTYGVGGFIGYRKSGAEIRNSLFAPAEVTVLNTSGATFARNKVDTYNSYYTYYLCDGTNYAPYDPADADHPDKYNNGHAPRTVSAGTGVTTCTVSPVGSPVEDGTYNVSGITAYANGITRGDEFYYGQGDQVSLTLSNTATAPLGYQYSGYTASAGTLSGTTLTMPDTDVTINIDTDHPRSTGEAVTVGYTDADGTLHDGDNAAQAIALDGSETSLAAGWYFVGLPEVSFDHTVTLGGNVTLILKDGCEMKVGTSESRISGKGISGGNNTLTIYGQSGQTGNLNIYSTSNASDDYGSIAILGSVNVNGGNVTVRHYGSYGNGIYADRITINGGNVDVKSDQKNAISVPASVTINGGTVKADGYNNGIQCTAGSVAINGGIVNATGGIRYGINATNGITLGWNKPTDRITASSYSGTVKVADGKMLTDGSGNILTGTLTANDINGKALYPYIENIAPTASEVEGNCWTTFYCGHTGYKIDDEENACAYTATVANSTITLHKLGKVIPAGTAVIIVGADSEISMTASTDAAEYPVSNSLHGVDLRTKKSELGTGTFYVLSKKSGQFGFFEYTGAYIPARKAYLLLDSQVATNGLTMVFDDEGETTAISDALRLNDKGQMTNDNFYDLQGRKIEKPTKGLYIVNGRKVVVK